MRKHLRALAIAGVALGLGVAGCGSPPPKDNGGDKQAGGKNEDFKACIVSDSGGFDDKSFNQTSYKGVIDAVEKYGISKAQLESNSDAEYPQNINTMVQQDCNIIVTVGFKLGNATYKAAKKHPDIDFAIVDYGFDPKKQPPLPNLKSLLFNSAQPSFLAGYLAAGMTESGKVGTFGGEKIPTVTIFMDGYWQGVQYYNKTNKANVKVLGWDAKADDGVFTNDFEDKNAGKNTARNLISQGADVIFPVAGPAGLGGLQAIKATGGKVHGIWVDTDGCVSAEAYCSVLLSSVVKEMDVAVTKAIGKSLHDKFDNEPYVGTLQNDGVSLAPYHEFESKIPQKLQKEIEQLKKDVISGKITIKSDAQPK